MAIASSETYIRSKRRLFSATRIRWPRPERRVDHLGGEHDDERQRERHAQAGEDHAAAALGSTTLRKMRAVPGAHVERRPDQDRRRRARAVVGVDEHRVEAGERDDQHLRQVADAEPEHEERQHHDLRHRVGEEHHRAEACWSKQRATPGGEAERDAERRADGEARQRAPEARADVGRRARRVPSARRRSA